MKLTKAEEGIMDIIWAHERLFLKDIIEHSPEPKPASSTVATLLKRMQDKGFVGYRLLGNSREYHALVDRTDYFSKHVKGMVKNYFGDSALQFASFFTTSGNLTTSELEALKKIIDQEIQKKKK